MKIAVTGAGGQLGQAMALRLSERHDGDGAGACRPRLSPCQADVLRVMAAIQPDVIVNCAAYNAVDRAEDDVLAALEGNAFGVQALARAAAREGAVLVHYSTDFVFDGNADQPYREDAPVAPLSVYGQSKLLGEWLTRDAPRRYILRVESLFGGPLPRSSIDRIAEAIRAGQETRVFADRVVSPAFVGGRRHRHGGVARAGGSRGACTTASTAVTPRGRRWRKRLQPSSARSRGWYPCVSPMFRCGHAVPATAPCRTRSWRPPASRCPPGRTPFVAISPRTDGPAEGRDAIING